MPDDQRFSEVHERINRTKDQVNEVDKRVERVTARLEEQNRNLTRTEAIVNQNTLHITDLQQLHKETEIQSQNLIRQLAGVDSKAEETKDLSHDLDFRTATLEKTASDEKARKGDWRRLAFKILGWAIVALLSLGAGWLIGGAS